VIHSDDRGNPEHRCGGMHALVNVEDVDAEHSRLKALGSGERTGRQPWRRIRSGTRTAICGCTVSDAESNA
jgi:hypothetical protein